MVLYVATIFMNGWICLSSSSPQTPCTCSVQFVPHFVDKLRDLVLFIVPFLLQCVQHEHHGVHVGGSQTGGPTHCLHIGLLGLQWLLLVFLLLVFLLLVPQFSLSPLPQILLRVTGHGLLIFLGYPHPVFSSSAIYVDSSPSAGFPILMRGVLASLKMLFMLTQTLTLNLAFSTDS